LVASSIYFPSFSRYVASIVSKSIGAKLLDFIDKGEISPVLVDCFREILFIAQHFGFFDVCLVTLLNIGYVYSLLGNYDLSMQYYNAVIDFYRQNPKRDYLGVFVRACFNLGELLHRFSRFSSAVNYYMMALEEIARFNASEDLVEDYVDLLVNLGATFYEMGLLRRAYEFYNEALNFIKTHVDFDSLYLADVIMSTGVILGDLGLLDDAERMIRDALDIYVELFRNHVIGPENVVQALCNLYDVYLEKNDSESASRCYRLCISLISELPMNSRPLYLGLILRRFGSFLASRFDLINAIRVYELALKFLNKTGSLVDQVIVYYNLAILYSEAGEVVKAMRYLDEAHNILISIGYENMPSLYVSILKSYGDIYLRSGNFVLAEHYLSDALNLALKFGIENELGEIYANLSVIYLKLMNPQKALIFAEKALGSIKNGKRNIKYIIIKDNIAQILMETGDAQGAKRIYEEILDLIRVINTPRGKIVHGMLLNNYGYLDLLNGDFVRAKEKFLESLRISEKFLHTDLGFRTYVQALLNLASMFYEEGYYYDAESFFMRGLKLLRGKTKLYPHLLASIKVGLGALYWRIGLIEYAEKELKDALRILERIDDYVMKVDCYINLGLISEEKEEFDSALRYFASALKILENCSGSQAEYLTILVKLNMSSVLIRLNELDRAESLLIECLETLGKVKLSGDFLDLYLRVQNNRSVIAKMRGRISDSERILRTSLEKLSVKGPIGSSLSLKLNLVNVLLDQDSVEEAYNLLRDIIAEFAKLSIGLSSTADLHVNLMLRRGLIDSLIRSIEIASKGSQKYLDTLLTQLDIIKGLEIIKSLSQINPLARSLGKVKQVKMNDITLIRATGYRKISFKLPKIGESLLADRESIRGFLKYYVNPLIISLIIASKSKLYIISIHDSSANVYRISTDLLELRQELTDVLKEILEGVWIHPEDFKTICTDLFKWLPEDLMSLIQSQAEKNLPIFLQPHGFLHELPWEYLPMQNGKPLGTMAPLIRELSFTFLPEPINVKSFEPLVIGVVDDGDPRTVRLPNVGEEITKIGDILGCDVILINAGEDREKFVINNVDERRWRWILSRISESNMIHISAHGDFKIYPEESYVKIFKDKILRAIDIPKLRKSKLGFLAFINSCKVGFSYEEIPVFSPIDTKAGFVRALHLAGFPLVILPAWSISDRIAKEFSITFYQNLLKLPWDKAIVRTREIIAEKFNDRIEWSSYMFYGHPIVLNYFKFRF